MLINSLTRLFRAEMRGPLREGGARAGPLAGTGLFGPISAAFA